MRISDWSSDVCSSDLDRDAAVRSVEQALVRLDHAVGQGRGVDREAVVHAGDLDHAVFRTLDRMVRAAMTLVHLYSFRARRQPKHLVAEADTDRKSTRLNSSH